MLKDFYVVVVGTEIVENRIYTDLSKAEVKWSKVKDSEVMGLMEYHDLIKETMYNHGKEEGYGKGYTDGHEYAYG